jgi:hypothetical protein
MIENDDQLRAAQEGVTTWQKVLLAAPQGPHPS